MTGSHVFAWDAATGETRELAPSIDAAKLPEPVDDEGIPLWLADDAAFHRPDAR